MKPGHGARRLTHRPNRVFELTRAVIRWAVEQEILAANPMLGMKRPIKKEAPRERTSSPAEIRVLWWGLDKVPTKRAPGRDGWHPSDVPSHRADDEAFTHDRSAHR